MFNKMRLRYYGYQTYGKIIEVKDVPVGLNRGYICVKRLTVQYSVNHQGYEVTQEIYKVLPKHKKVMIEGNFIRILVNENDPMDAYINEFDYPEYEL